MAFAEEAVTNWPLAEADSREELCAFVESGFVVLLGSLDHPARLDTRS
jgi:hypothetical protein